jgi:ankyrin repeat protein
MWQPAHDALTRDRYEDTHTSAYSTDAAYCGSAQVAQTLLAHGADPNAKTNDDKTSLDCAQEAGFADVAHGNRYIICHLHLRDFSEMPLGSEFPVIADGWWTVVTVIFDLTNRTVVAVNCNGA